MKGMRICLSLLSIITFVYFGSIANALAQNAYDKVHILEAYPSFAAPDGEFYNETPRHALWSDTTVFLYIKYAVGDQAGSHVIVNWLTNAAGQRIGEFNSFATDAPNPNVIRGFRRGEDLSAGVYFFHAAVIGPDGTWAFQNAPVSFIVQDRP